MKKTLLILSLCFMCVSAFSQFMNGDVDQEKPFKFGFGSAISLPAGDFKPIAAYGLGFDMLAAYAVSGNIEIFTQAGLHIFKASPDLYAAYGDAANFLHIPLLGGVRLWLDGFVVGAGAGFGFFEENGGTASGFLYSPQVGYDFGHMQVLLHYTATATGGNGTFSYIGLKLFRTF